MYCSQVSASWLASFPNASHDANQRKKDKDSFPNHSNYSTIQLIQRGMCLFSNPLVPIYFLNFKHSCMIVIDVPILHH